MIVVDTNIVTYLILPTDRTHLVEKALRKDANWAAPRLWRSEYCNVLVTYLKNGVMTIDMAQKKFNEGLNFMRDREFPVNYQHVISLAESSRCSAYDCEFVALAYALHTQLLTVDKRILTAFPQRAISLEAFVSS